jgi:PadR family transcriptional regulator, regulatory protein PadR
MDIICPAPDIKDLLERWEESYKKGLLSFWLLLLLHERPTYAFEMNARIISLSRGTISADENSIYRALNRFEEIGVVSSELQASTQGPARRYYHLTEKGSRLLSCFIERNILLFQEEEVEKRIKEVVNGRNPVRSKP